MVHTAKLLRAVSFICGTVIILGFISFLVGFFGNGTESLTGIGIGLAMGGVFIFIMGTFLAVTEEIVEKNKQNTLS